MFKSKLFRRKIKKNWLKMMKIITLSFALLALLPIYLEARSMQPLYQDASPSQRLKRSSERKSRDNNYLQEESLLAIPKKFLFGTNDPEMDDLESQDFIPMPQQNRGNNGRQKNNQGQPKISFDQNYFLRRYEEEQKKEASLTLHSSSTVSSTETSSPVWETVPFSSDTTSLPHFEKISIKDRMPKKDNKNHETAFNNVEASIAEDIVLISTEKLTSSSLILTTPKTNAEKHINNLKTFNKYKNNSRKSSINETNGLKIASVPTVRRKCKQSSHEESAMCKQTAQKTNWPIQNKTNKETKEKKKTNKETKEQNESHYQVSAGIHLEKEREMTKNYNEDEKRTKSRTIIDEDGNNEMKIISPFANESVEKTENKSIDKLINESSTEGDGNAIFNEPGTKIVGQMTKPNSRRESEKATLILKSNEKIILDPESRDFIAPTPQKDPVKGQPKDNNGHHLYENDEFIKENIHFPRINKEFHSSNGMKRFPGDEGKMMESNKNLENVHEIIFPSQGQGQNKRRFIPIAGLSNNDDNILMKKHKNILQLWNQQEDAMDNKENLLFKSAAPIEKMQIEIQKLNPKQPMMIKTSHNKNKKILRTPSTGGGVEKEGERNHLSSSNSSSQNSSSSSYSRKKNLAEQRGEDMKEDFVKSVNEVKSMMSSSPSKNNSENKNLSAALPYEWQAPSSRAPLPSASPSTTTKTTLPSMFEENLIPPLPPQWPQRKTEGIWENAEQVNMGSPYNNNGGKLLTVDELLRQEQMEKRLSSSEEDDLSYVFDNLSEEIVHDRTNKSSPLKSTGKSTNKERQNYNSKLFTKISFVKNENSSSEGIPTPAPQKYDFRVKEQDYPDIEDDSQLNPEDLLRKYFGPSSNKSGGGAPPIPTVKISGKADVGDDDSYGKEKINFITVPPGSHWHLWSGFSTRRRVDPFFEFGSNTNMTRDVTQVYTSYWGISPTSGGVGKIAGIWILRFGAGLSLLALIITVAAQTARFCLPHLSQKAVLTTNLATSLAAAHIVFIFGIKATDGSWMCGVVSLFLHFLYLLTCNWILALSIRLLRGLLQKSPFHTATYCVPVWVASLAVVVVSYGMNPSGYETRNFCWLSVERGMLFAFIGPVCTLLMVNAAICIACQKLILDAGVKSDPIDRTDLRAGVTLLPLHGVAWFLAVVALEDEQSLALDCVSAIAMAAQGYSILHLYVPSWQQFLYEQFICPHPSDPKEKCQAGQDNAQLPLLESQVQPSTSSNSFSSNSVTANSTVSGPVNNTSNILLEEYPLDSIYKPSTSFRRDVY